MKPEKPLNPVDTQVSFPELEKNIFRYWIENKIIEKGLKHNEGKDPFIFYDGPPFATGLPHYGHILAGTLKDIVPRYWVMKGHYVSRRWGWDCHGLPVEFEMEKELGLSGLHDIEKYGIANFNESCRSIVLRYTKEWKEVIERTGRWADFEKGYRTMDSSFMESVWWAIQELWNKGLIYEGHRVMPYSWRISTPLSNFEAGLNYKEVQDPSLFIKFKSLKQDRYLLAWTTTPWTLPSNMGLNVHPDLEYVEVRHLETGEKLVLAKARLEAVLGDESKYEVLNEFSGKALEKEKYQPLFPFYADFAQKNAFQVCLAEYVSVADGTGVVHCAPAFGEEDYEVGKKYGLPLVDPVDAEGKFTAEVPPYKGQQVKEADKNIIKDLKAAKVVFKHETIVHNYPFCWRSETPLIYKAISTWFLKLDPIKEKMIAQNKTTHWVPEYLRDGRFGNWLENARDWNISRNRFWGTPIPIWKSEDGETYCVGSVAELEKLTGEKVTDLHKHFIDKLSFKSPKTGKLMHRIPEVLDCWFESGSMPFAQVHYPFENKEKFDKYFPADFIAEGLDQTRGWFYTLTVLSAALFGKSAFKNVAVNGLILAEDGKKMSKRLKNYPDPVEVLNNYGADSLRAYLMNSPASHAEELRFSEAGVKEMVRSVLLPLWNAYAFFVTYANADGWTSEQFKPQSLDKLSDPLDRWILSRLQSLIVKVDEKMAIYHLYEVVPAVLSFIDDLTNWYIRLNRRRFWEDGNSSSKENAYSTLFFVLKEFNKILAPILPFITEAIYQNLEKAEGKPESVHFCDFPKVKEAWIDTELEEEMKLVNQVVVMGRSCRNTCKIKNRQPLSEMKIITTNPRASSVIQKFSGLFESELNVKKVSLETDEKKWVEVSAKANAKTLGPKLGKKMQSVLKAVKELSSEKIRLLEKQGFVEIEGENISKEDLVIERKPKIEGAIQTEGEVTVWLNTQLSESLLEEGLAREFVNRVQKQRKDDQLNITDRIEIHVAGSAEWKTMTHNFWNYISQETLAEKIHWHPSLEGSSHDFEGATLILKISVIS